MVPSPRGRQDGRQMHEFLHHSLQESHGRNPARGTNCQCNMHQITTKTPSWHKENGSTPGHMAYANTAELLADTMQPTIKLRQHWMTPWEVAPTSGSQAYAPLMDVRGDRQKATQLLPPPKQAWPPTSAASPKNDIDGRLAQQVVT